MNYLLNNHMKNYTQLRSDWKKYSTSIEYAFGNVDTCDYWLSVIKAREKELKKKVENMKVPLTHSDDCEFQRKGCECGYTDRLVCNKTLDQVLKIFKQE